MEEPESDHRSGFAGAEPRDGIASANISSVLRAWREAEANAERFREEVFAALGRGVRGPVSHVSGLSGLLLDTELTAEQLEYVQGIQQASGELLHFISELLGSPSPQSPTLLTLQPSGGNPYQNVEPATKASSRILIADDDPTARTLAARMLERIGYQSDTVENGLEALNAVQNHAYAAILMDCKMPQMDGYQATRAIRHLTGRACETPVIALTANALQGDDMACSVAGMDDYLTKPVDPRKLAEVLAKWVLPDAGRKRA